MITNLDDKLTKLQEDIAKKKRITVLLKELDSQKDELTDKVFALDRIRIKEEKDVDKVEGISLQSLMYTVSGKRKEKLSKERKEAYVAVAKFDLAVGELDRVLAYIKELNGELDELKNCEFEYEKVLNNKIMMIKMNDEEKAKEFEEYEKRIVELEKNIIEIDEAMCASNKAIDKINQVIRCLENAIEYSNKDMLGPSSEYSMLKHGELDKAHRLIKSLHFNLVKVKAELEDVDFYSLSNMNVKVNGFLKFADFFLDGLFIDSTVHNHINEVMKEVNQMKDDLKGIIDNLKDRKKENENEVITIKNKIERLAKLS